MNQYITALNYILANGAIRSNRTGTDTIGVFGYQMRFNLQSGFPVVTTKKLAWKSVVSELLWFLEGSTNERRLAEILYQKPAADLIGDTTIWTDNADSQGKELGYQNTDVIKELGPIYGRQWRGGWSGVDQITNLIDNIKTSPFSRRHILNSWNVSEVHNMGLPPCHVMAQFYVDNSNKLHCQLYQRSADMFLGVPFNIASYSLLTHIIAQLCGLQVGEFIHTIGDAHIYSTHVDQVNQQIERTVTALPTLSIRPSIKSLNDVLCSTIDDYTLLNYDPAPAIKAQMAV